jgi:hypothetical protein
MQSIRMLRDFALVVPATAHAARILYFTPGSTYSIKRLRDAWKRSVDDQKQLRRWRSLRHHTNNRHTLQPFDEHQCIFFHVPKTGGTSVNTALFGRTTGGHRTVLEYRQIFGKSTFDKYFKFAFVRNPWDWLVSTYFYCKQGGRFRCHRWAEEHLREYDTFESFVYGWFERGNERSLHKIFLPQHHYLCDENGTLAVNFLGLFENFEEDFAHVQRSLGGIGSKLNHRNASKHRSYQDYYTNETREIVAQAYKTDIELFGYEFLTNHRLS